MGTAYVLKKGEEFPDRLRLARDISCTLSERIDDVLIMGPVIPFSIGTYGFDGIARTREGAISDLKRKMVEEFQKWRYPIPEMNPAMQELSIKLGELFGLTKEQVIAE